MKKSEKRLRPGDFFYYLMRGRRLIAVFAVIGMIVGIILSGIGYLRGEMSKEYKITSSIAIIAMTRSGTYASSKESPEAQDVRLAQEITDSAIYILRSERTIKAAIDHLNLEGVSVRDIQNNLSLKQYNDTQIIELSLDWRSSAEGVRILEAINAVSGEILLETLKIGNVSVVNSPTAKYVIGGNVSASTWIICAVLGAVFAAALCILKMFVSPQVTDTDDFEKRSGLKLLNSISYDRYFDESVPFAEDGTRAKKDIVSLAYILSNSMDKSGFKRVVVTSAIRGEGKTTLTANIAQQMALMGKSTLMVDCSFNNPTLSSMFKGQIPYEKTLNAVYRGDIDEVEAVTHIADKLDLLPVTMSDNPVNFDDAMLEIIRNIAAPYDYVLFDCAPIGTNAEVIKLRETADTALFVVKYGYADLDSIEDALVRLEGSGIDTVGCAITSTMTAKDIMRESQRILSFIQSAKKRAEKTEKSRQRKANGRRKNRKKK